MNKFFVWIVLFIAGSSLAMAQEENWTKREKMFREVQEFKMKYLAQEMELSELQKKKFFELYEDMTRSKQECFQNAIDLDRKIKHEKGATDADYQQVTEAFNKANAESAEIDRQYNEKFAEFLSPKQIYQMKEAENEFRVKMDQMRHNRKKDDHKKHDKK